MRIKVCLNGARAGSEHPALPLTPAALADAARAAVAAGAEAIHMHPRDTQGAQSLAPTVIGAAVTAVRQACPGIPVGVSTLFSILPYPAQRVDAVMGWEPCPDFASVNISEPGTPELVAALLARGIGIEAGIDSAAEAELYLQSALVGTCLRVLIEPGEPAVADALATVAAIEAILDRAGDPTPRLLHGDGPTAWALVDAAQARGYATRIGFEDILTLPDGTRAPDNAALVAEALRRSPRAG